MEKQEFLVTVRQHKSALTNTPVGIISTIKLGDFIGKKVKVTIEEVE